MTTPLWEFVFFDARLGAFDGRSGCFDAASMRGLCRRRPDLFNASTGWWRRLTPSECAAFHEWYVQQWRDQN